MTILPDASIRLVAKELVAGFILRGILFSFALGAGLFVVGLLAGLYALEAGLGTSLSMALFYGVFGLAIGYALALASTAKRLLGKIAPDLHRLLEPRVNEMVRAIPFGKDGISLSQFQREMDSKLNTELRAAGQAEGGLGGRLKTFVTRRLIAALRTALAKNYTAYLEKRGGRLVTADNVGAFLRDKLVTLLMDNAQRQINTIRVPALIVGTIMCVGPLLVAALS